MQGVPRALPDCSNRASLADVSQFRTKKNNALSRGRRAHHYEHWPVISGHSEIGPDSRAVRPITPVKSRSHQLGENAHVADVEFGCGAPKPFLPGNTSGLARLPGIGCRLPAARSLCGLATFNPQGVMIHRRGGVQGRARMEISNVLPIKYSSRGRAKICGHWDAHPV
jgi:hypothetical protein